MHSARLFLRWIAIGHQSWSFRRIGKLCSGVSLEDLHRLQFTALPKPAAAAKGVEIRTERYFRRKPSPEFLGIAAPQHQIFCHECRLQPRQAIDHGMSPLALAEFFERFPRK